VTTPDTDSPTTVIFDIGNVLLDWDPRHLYRKIFSCADEMEWFLSHVCTTQWLRDLDRGVPFMDAVAQLSARFPDYAREIAAFDARWQETLTGTIDGSVRLLEQLFAQGVPLYALTNFSAEKYVETQPLYSFFARFRGVLVSGAEGMIKPDLAIYRLMLARYGLEASRCFFIDDSAANVESAKSVGIDAVRFTDPAQFEKALRERDLL
jgi:HAD superfamily hydrolase (TIGR01509 family)